MKIKMFKEETVRVGGKPILEIKDGIITALEDCTISNGEKNMMTKFKFYSNGDKQFVLSIENMGFTLGLITRREALYLSGLINKELDLEDNCHQCANLGYIEGVNMDDEPRVYACDFCKQLATDEEAQDLAEEEGVL